VILVQAEEGGPNLFTIIFSLPTEFSNLPPYTELFVYRALFPAGALLSLVLSIYIFMNCVRIFFSSDQKYWDGEFPMLPKPISIPILFAFSIGLIILSVCLLENGLTYKPRVDLPSLPKVKFVKGN
jgi:hypothetical protein